MSDVVVVTQGGPTESSDGGLRKNLTKVLDDLVCESQSSIYYGGVLGDEPIDESEQVTYINRLPDST